MGAKTETALRNHSGGNNCSVSVLGAFRDDAGLSEQEARTLAMPMAGGRMGKCGAVLAAEAVIEHRYAPEEARKLTEQLEERFQAMNKSILCRELRGGAGKPRLRSCHGCVEDAAAILEEILSAT